MRPSTSARPVRVVARSLAIGLVPALLLAACGGDSSESSDTLQEIQATSYVVRDPATTTTTVPTDATASADGTSPVEQQYTVVFGDAVYSIASKYGVDPVELANYNKWPEGINHPINVGDIVLIPPGAQIPGATATETDTGTDTETTDAAGDDDTETATETTAAGLADNCKAGDYTIEAGDTPIGVANKFDVTLDQLNAANANTNGYSAFYVGLVIVIPEKDC